MNKYLITFDADCTPVDEIFYSQQVIIDFDVTAFRNHSVMIDHLKDMIRAQWQSDLATANKYVMGITGARSPNAKICITDWLKLPV